MSTFCWRLGSMAGGRQGQRAVFKGENVGGSQDDDGTLPRVRRNGGSDATQGRVVSSRGSGNLACWVWRWNSCFAA